MLTAVSSLYSDKSFFYEGLGVANCSGLTELYNDCITEFQLGKKRVNNCSELHELSTV